jgi:DNA polymerase elongation subunit (family B)
MRGWIFDTYPDYQKDHMVSWIKTEDGVEKLVDRKFFPTFYVHGSRKNLKSLADVVSTHKLRDLSFQRQKIKLGYDGKFEVLAVTPYRYKDVKLLAKMIDAQGGYRDFELYNIDIRLAQRYLVERGIFPMAYVDVGREFILLDEQMAMEYPLPELTHTEIGVKVGSDNKIKKFNDPLQAIKVGELVLKDEEEIDLLRGMVQEIRRTDPDIIYMKNGDSFLLPYLYNRAKTNGILDDIQLGRENQSSRPERSGRSYFRYGRVEYKPPLYTLRGRLHIDTGNSFLHMESGLKGLIELSRLSCIPIQTLAKLSPGTAISAMQVNQAMKNGHPVMWKKNLPEDFKTAKELMVTDRGGFIYEPVVGIHNRVLELDYTSLYPSIMVRFNISPETLKCSCCPDSKIKVPEIGYNICEKQVGLIAKVLKPVIQRRMVYKKRGKEGDLEYKERSDILKWLLVTAFGFTGYRNARYGRIECHESITAYGREIMIRSAEIAERHGYRVLHGIVDSLWLEGNGSPKAVAEHMRNDIGIPIEIEGVYKWVVFLPCKSMDVGAMNRYYGLFENGEMKIRGIETRRRDMPELVKKAQYEMLDILSKAEDSQEFKETIPEALGALKVWAERVVYGDVDLEDLIFTSRISKPLEEYSHFSNQVAALTQLEEHMVDVNPGEIVRYMLVNSESMKASERLKIADLVEDGDEYDKKKYVEHLFKAGESLFQSFGYDLERIEEEYGV